MTSFIKFAKHVHDIESDISYVEVIYDRYVNGKGYETYNDYINTEPLAELGNTRVPKAINSLCKIP